MFQEQYIVLALGTMDPVGGGGQTGSLVTERGASHESRA